MDNKPKRNYLAEFAMAVFFLLGLASAFLWDVQMGIFFMLAALVVRPKYL